MLVSVCVTVTARVLVVELPDASATVTQKVYDPAAVKVAVVLAAAVVPLAENVTAPGGVPINDQVYVSAPLPNPLGAAAVKLVVVPVTVAFVVIVGWADTNCVRTYAEETDESIAFT